MSSRQSGAKRDNFNEKSLQNQGTLADNEEGENGEIKRGELQTNPFKIGTILENVMSYLDAASIKKARQVNQPWSEEGAKMLINKCFLKIPEGLREGETFAGIKVLERFRAFLSLKSNDVSMIPHIIIEGDEDVELWEHFGVLGPQVKSLKFTWNVDRWELFSSLLDLMPNLTYIEFSTDSYGIMDVSNMKVLTEVMSKAAEDRKRKPLVMVIPRMLFQTVSAKMLEEIEKFAKCSNIMIQELKFATEPSVFRDVPELEARIVSTISKLLSNSQSVLKELSLFNCEMYLPLLEFPLMSKLGQLKLEFHPLTPVHLQQCKFSPSFQFSEKTPNLTSVNIKYQGIEPGLNNDFFGNLLENSGTASSVKYLQYSDSDLRVNIDPLLQTFPNIEKFENRQTGCSETMFHSLWKYGQNLKTLDITIDMEDTNHKVGDLDSIFTGFAPGTVDKMRTSRKLASYTLEKLQKLRVNPSILDLKELQSLTIHINGTGKPFMPKRMLAIAGKYAFQYMPKDAKIRINVWLSSVDPSEHAEKALVQVSRLPNVTVDVEYDDYEEDFFDYDDEEYSYSWSD